MLTMNRRLAIASALASGLATLTANTAASSATMAASQDGLVRNRSVYPFAETIVRLKADIAKKGIVFFSAIDQAKLASDAKVSLRPSTLLMFGNPALGSQFITSNPNAGIDWPVRLLVQEDEQGQVWTVYTDFDWIAERYKITNRAAAFAMASKVIASITSSVANK